MVALIDLVSLCNAQTYVTRPAKWIAPSTLHNYGWSLFLEEEPPPPLEERLSHMLSAQLVSNSCPMHVLPASFHG